MALDQKHKTQAWNIPRATLQDGRNAFSRNKNSAKDSAVSRSHETISGETNNEHSNQQIAEILFKYFVAYSSAD